MGIFQKTIIDKYKETNSKEIAKAYAIFQINFLNPDIQENIKNIKEEQFQGGFLTKLFVEVLGYTLNPEPNYNLIREQKNVQDAKKADGAITVDNEVVGIIELKDLKTADLKKVETQAFGYKNNHRKAVYVITSNFEKLRFYINNTIDFVEFNLFTLTLEEFAELWLCLAYKNIKNELPLQMKKESVSSEDQITNKLYKEYSEFKRALFNDLVNLNPTIDKLTLFKKSQKLLDRFLFILFSEDSGLLPINTIKQIVERWEKLKSLDAYQSLYEGIKQYFEYINSGGREDVYPYNGGLFLPDEILDTAQISDSVLHKYLLLLSEYNFKSEVDVNILGRIFENSLTEIEEVTKAIEGNEDTTQASVQVSKRKKDGVFYTPRYITTYIVENTIGKLCTDKKAELEILEEDYFADKKRHKATSQKLLEKLDAYRKWLKELTICDPACGSGAFLNAALDFLITEHKLIDGMTAKIHKSALIFADIENAILEKNLYGVDINEESVEIAKLSLWLRTAKKNRKLNSLSNNIKCGNSLISDPEVAGDKAFDWEKEFPHVFAKGGFDVVIGNPPYVLVFDIPIKKYLEDNFFEFKRNNDLYSAFISKAFKILKDKGAVSFITPNSYVKGNYFIEIRNLLSQNRILSILDFNTKLVFRDANVFSAIFIATKDMPLKEWALMDDIDVIRGIVTSNGENFSPQNKIIENLRKHKTIDDFFLVRDVGYNYWTIGRGKVRGLSIGDKILYAGEQKSHLDIPYIKGGDFIAYSKPILKNYLRHNYLELLSEDDIFRFSKEILETTPKIIYRQTSSKIIASIDTKGYHTDKTVHTIINRESNNIDLYPLVCILNSKLANYIYDYFADEIGRAFAQVKTVNIKKIPFIYKADIFKTLKSLCIQQISVSKDLQSTRQRFIRRLTDNLEGVNINRRLSVFDDLDFKQFTAELKKQKIELSLKQQDDWEEYFNSNKSKCNDLSKELEATNKEIDQMVYKLYELTDEEIGIVENS